MLSPLLMVSEPRDIVGVVRELSDRCDSGSHLSEEIDNAGISPADLADALLDREEKLRQLEKDNEAQLKLIRILSDKLSSLPTQ